MIEWLGRSRRGFLARLGGVELFNALVFQRWENGGKLWCSVSHRHDTRQQLRHTLCSSPKTL